MDSVQSTFRFHKEGNYLPIMETNKAPEQFHEIITFLNKCPLQYALTVNPRIYKNPLLHFWNNAEVIENGDFDEPNIISNIGKYPVRVCPTSINQTLFFPKHSKQYEYYHAEVFATMQAMGCSLNIDGPKTIPRNIFGIKWRYLFDVISRTFSRKTGGRDQIPFKIQEFTHALVNRLPFNYGWFIFDQMVEMLTEVKKNEYKIAIYPRFLTMLLRNQLGLVFSETGPQHFVLKVTNYTFIHLLKTQQNVHADPPLLDTMVNYQSYPTTPIDESENSNNSKQEGTSSFLNSSSSSSDHQDPSDHSDQSTSHYSYSSHSRIKSKGTVGSVSIEVDVVESSPLHYPSQAIPESIQTTRVLSHFGDTTLPGDISIEVPTVEKSKLPHGQSASKPNQLSQTHDPIIEMNQSPSPHGIDEQEFEPTSQILQIPVSSVSQGEISTGSEDVVLVDLQTMGADILKEDISVSKSLIVLTADEGAIPEAGNPQAISSSELIGTGTSESAMLSSIPTQRSLTVTDRIVPLLAHTLRDIQSQIPVCTMIDSIIVHSTSAPPHDTHISESSSQLLSSLVESMQTGMQTPIVSSESHFLSMSVPVSIPTLSHTSFTSLSPICLSDSIFVSIPYSTPIHTVTSIHTESVQLSTPIHTSVSIHTPILSSPAGQQSSFGTVRPRQFFLEQRTEQVRNRLGKIEADIHTIKERQDSMERMIHQLLLNQEKILHYLSSQDNVKMGEKEKEKETNNEQNKGESQDEVAEIVQKVVQDIQTEDIQDVQVVQDVQTTDSTHVQVVNTSQEASPVKAYYSQVQIIPTQSHLEVQPIQEPSSRTAVYRRIPRIPRNPRNIPKIGSSSLKPPGTDKIVRFIFDTERKIYEIHRENGSIEHPKRFKDFKLFTPSDIYDLRKLKLECPPDHYIERLTKDFIDGLHHKNMQKGEIAQKAYSQQKGVNLSKGAELKTKSAETKAKKTVSEKLTKSLQSEQSLVMSTQSEDSKRKRKRGKTSTKESNEEEEMDLSLPEGIEQPPGTIIGPDDKPDGIYFQTNKQLRFVRYKDFQRLPLPCIQEIEKQLFEVQGKWHKSISTVFVRLGIWKDKRMKELAQKQEEEILARWNAKKPKPPSPKGWKKGEWKKPKRKRK